MNPPLANPNSIPNLLRDLRDETTTLLRQEVALAKTELRANLSRVLRNAARIAIGGFVAYAGIIVFLIGIGHLLGALLLRSGLNPLVAVWLATLIVGLVVATMGWFMLSKAKRALLNDDLTPRHTIQSLHDNKQWAKDKLSQSP